MPRNYNISHGAALSYILQKLSDLSIMARNIENISLEVVSNIGNLKDGAYVSSDLMVSMNSQKFGQKFLAKGRPYRIGEGRVMRITSGRATSIINLEKVELHEGLLAVVPKGSIFEIIDITGDFNIEMFSYQGFPDEGLFTHCTILNLSTEEWLLAGEYFQLIWHEVNRRRVLVSTIHHLQAALLTDLKAIYNNDSKNQKMSHRETIVHNFIDLVNEYGLKEHSQKFYADRLCITPSYLGAVVKEVSGETVMTWIERNITMHAKSMLKYSDKMVFEIADELNFSGPSVFTKFFKRHTGLTPKEYRRL